MNSIIEKASGNWAAAIRDIATQSTLMQAFTWLGGLLFAFAAVTTAQVLATYVSQKVAEIMLIMSSSTDDKAVRVANAAGLALAAHLITRLKEAQKQRVLLSRASAAEMPIHENVVPIVPDKTGQALSPKLKLAVDWLKEHPDSGLTVRAAAEAASVSRTTMQTAIRYIADRRQ